MSPRWQLIDAAVASKPDGPSLIHASALSESGRNAVASGIPVIVIDPAAQVTMSPAACRSWPIGTTPA
jgi:hypothetical protein